VQDQPCAHVYFQKSYWPQTRSAAMSVRSEEHSAQEQAHKIPAYSQVAMQHASEAATVREALALALAERKQATKAMEVGWKRKALAARSTLLRMSKSLRTVQGQGAGANLAHELLDQLEVDSDAWSESTQQFPQGAVVEVQARTSHLQAFMDAVEVRGPNWPCLPVHLLHCGAPAVGSGR
jgi:hypothetical protein